jgi:hypothetical protein
VIAAAVLAASVLAPQGVTAEIQADPVCLAVTAQPGHSYPLTVYVQGSGPLTLTVATVTSGMAARLHQVPASWVSFGQDPASGTVPLTLAVPSGAAPGAYESDIEATAGSPVASGSGDSASLGAGATTAIVFTVGPSSTPPPPCDALDLAQSTGKFPAWPNAAFATTGWPQVFARERASEPRPYLSPTASSAPVARAVPVAAYSPAASASGTSRSLPANWPGWLALIVIGLLVLRGLLKLLGIGK